MPYGNDKSLPATLFVESVNFNPEMNFKDKRVTVIDVELNETDVQKVLDELKKRRRRKTPGTVRIRFTGRLVL